ncbi:MAG TPA: cyanophycinase [Parafilimonas sp.]|nr:cyanophycinase [Parafilimonas sp.]
MRNRIFHVSAAALLCLHVFSQPKGNLFIIGGGSRSDELMHSLVSTAQLRTNDYIVVLPMATTEPDTSFYYISEDLEKVCSNKIVSFNFTQRDVNKKQWLDSVQNAKLIFITGGDQIRFMNVVLNTPIQAAIQKAYDDGATVAGTSAGAAVMSYYMVTGNQLLGDTTYESTFPKLWYNNVEITQGLGLVDSAIIDQHFIARSRYNRMLSAVAQFPTLPCIGIDEGTAVIIHANNVKVAGTSQVIVFSHPQNLRVTDKGYIKFDDIEMRIYTAGDEFAIKAP